MKTNSAARRLVRIRSIVLVLAFLGMVPMAFSFGGSMAARIGQYTTVQAEAPQAPSLSIGEFMAAAALSR
jgi:hypothetical protein